MLHDACIEWSFPFAFFSFSGSKIARNVMAMAAGESSMMATGEATVDMATTELPQIVKTIQEAVRIFCTNLDLSKHMII